MKPVNKNATKEACELLEYLYDIAGKKIITGQHTQTVSMEERHHIYNITGKYPKLQGFELLAYSPNINYDGASEECIREVEENKNTVEIALDWAKTTGGIVSICFHWFSPIGGRDKSFYTENTDFDASNVFVKDSVERKAFFSDLDVIAEELRRFQVENIPVLWRPFHESEGTWFWWGAKGHTVARDLYKLMFDYFVNTKHLDNLLWVWNAPVKEAYPGDEFVDVVSCDTYIEARTLTDYRETYENLIANTSNNKVAALAEVGIIPDITILQESHIPWVYYMTWSKDFCTTEKFNTNETLMNMYNSDYAITL